MRANRKTTRETRKAKAFVLFLAGKGTQEVAVELGVHRNTVGTYRKEFEQQISERAKAAEDQALENLEELVPEAIEAVKRNLNCGDARWELKAAELILGKTRYPDKKSVEQKSETTHKLPDGPILQVSREDLIERARQKGRR